MTGILLCCLLVVLLAAAIYLVAARPDVAAAWMYRLLHDPDPWGWRARIQSRLLVIRHGDPYPTEAADAPDALDEHFDTAPRVVAGQDLDDHRLVAELQQAYADYRRGVDVFAGAIHEPSPEVRK